MDRILLRETTLTTSKTLDTDEREAVVGSAPEERIGGLSGGGGPVSEAIIEPMADDRPDEGPGSPIRPPINRSAKATST